MAEGLGLSGLKSWLNITAATLIDAAGASSYTGRRVGRINVLVAGTTPGSVNDAATVGQVAAANAIFAIPNVVGSYSIDFPCLAGIVITPGSGQTVAVSYD